MSKDMLHRAHRARAGARTLILVLGIIIASSRMQAQESSSGPTLGYHHGRISRSVEIGFAMAEHSAIGSCGGVPGLLAYGVVAEVDLANGYMGPRVSAWMNGLVSLGLSVGYSVAILNPEKGSVVVRPELGLGVSGGRIYYGYNIMRKGFAGGGHEMGVQLYIPVVEHKRKEGGE